MLANNLGMAGILYPTHLGGQKELSFGRPPLKKCSINNHKHLLYVEFKSLQGDLHKVKPQRIHSSVVHFHQCWGESRSKFYFSLFLEQKAKKRIK